VTVKLKIPRVVKNWEFAKFVTPSVDNFKENVCGCGRKYSKQPTVMFWQEAFRCFNLNPIKVEPTFENFTGVHYIDGAFVHEHKDPTLKGFDHIRCNLMLKKPAYGGNPVIDNEEIHVEVNDLWLCISNREFHKSTPIQGGERIIFSFGGLVPVEQIEAILNNR
jgi:hypothetical protein